MAKEGEKAYLRNLGEEGRRHALGKPFSDLNCGMYLADLGTIMKLLPPPPAKLLDLGVGTGWTSCFLQLAGYEVVGVDIAESMIECAEENRVRYAAEGVRFIVSDYESLDFSEEFDAAVFYDSLHHSIDEREALLSAFRALKGGGVLVCHEPGEGHAKAKESIKASERYGITERDMPPWKILETAEDVGFSRHQLFEYPHRPRQIGPISDLGGKLRFYWRQLITFFGSGSEQRKGYRRRNLVVLWK